MVLAATFPFEPVIRTPRADDHFPMRDDKTCGYVKFVEALPKKRKAVKRAKK